MSEDIAKNDEKRKVNRDRQRRYRQKYKDAGLKEVRLWVPEDSEFLLHILAAQLREREFFARPTDKQIDFVKDIINELQEPIPEKAVLSKRAMSLWIKEQKSRFYDASKSGDEQLKAELELLGLSMEKSKKASPRPRKKILKGTKRPWVKTKPN